ncbi:lipid II flippase MurJ [Rhodococcoides corynebacterioides]|uniref:lipid II flippase MurJ n=1 Tax=Rhodococcoides corynebacterioides TaxID=53972 RepID=UPI003F802705
MVIGFLFQSIAAALLGLTPLADQFQLTWAIVTFGTVIFATMVTTLIVPRIRDSAGVLHIGDALPIAIMGGIGSSAQVVAAQLTDDSLQSMLLWSAPSHLLAAMSAVAQSIAYLDKQFGAAASVGVANGVGLLCGVIVPLLTEVSPVKLGLSLTIGYLFQTAYIIGRTRSHFREAERTKVIGVRVLIFVTLFTMLTKAQPLAERYIAEFFTDSSTAALGYGQKIAQGLLLFAAFGLALTATGSLAAYVQAERMPEAARLLSRTLLATLVTSTGVIITFLPFGPMAIRVLFERGEFSPSDTSVVSTIVLAQIPWVLANALAGVITGFMYVARQFVRVGIAAATGLIATCVAVYLSSKFTDDYAVAIASSVGSFSTLACVAVFLVRNQIFALVLGELSRARRLVLLIVASLIVSYALALLRNAHVISHAVGTTAGCTLIVVSCCAMTGSSQNRKQLKGMFNAAV